MSATWSGKPAKAASERDTLSEGASAYAASLALTSLSEAMARKLAVGEGLVTHLTSLVLVDEEGRCRNAARNPEGRPAHAADRRGHGLLLVFA